MTKTEQLERGDFAPTRVCVEKNHDHEYCGTMEDGRDVLRCYTCFPTWWSSTYFLLLKVFR